MELLPVEIIETIISDLSFLDLINLSKTNKYFQYISDNNSIWSLFLFRDHGCKYQRNDVKEVCVGLYKMQMFHSHQYPALLNYVKNEIYKLIVFDPIIQSLREHGFVQTPYLLYHTAIEFNLSKELSLHLCLWNNILRLEIYVTWPFYIYFDFPVADHYKNNKLSSTIKKSALKIATFFKNKSVHKNIVLEQQYIVEETKLFLDSIPCEIEGSVNFCGGPLIFYCNTDKKYMYISERFVKRYKKCT